MKKIVIYSSLTGNTRKIGEAIAMELGCKAFSFEDQMAQNLSEFDFVAVGFYIDKGDMDTKFKQYIKTHLKNKSVGLFITLGADPLQHGQSSLQTGRELLEKYGNKVVREFISQGAIDPNVIQQMIDMAAKMGDKARHLITPERQATWKQAASHPDENDIANAKEAFKNL